MSTISQRIHRAQSAGYWATEKIRQVESAGPGKQYLCQAQARLPPLGQYQTVAGPAEWAEWGAAREALELAGLPERGEA